MSASNFIGMGIWVTKKGEQLKDAYELYEQTKTTDAALGVFTKLSEMAAGIAVGYTTTAIVTALQTSGLDRVFDSIRKNKSLEKYIQEQKIYQNIFNFTAGEATDAFINWGRDYATRNGTFDPAFKFFDDLMKDVKGGINSQDSLFNTDKQLFDWYRQGEIDKAAYDDYSRWSTERLLGDYFFYKPPSFTDWYDPIGAFYESRSPGFDPATLIANKTFRITDANGRGMNAAQLAALDVNGDGKLDGAELNNLYVWSDLNENGILDRSNTNTNEFMTLAAGLANAGMTNLRAGDYEFYTRGNASARAVGQASLYRSCQVSH